MQHTEGKKHSNRKERMVWLTNNSKLTPAQLALSDVIRKKAKILWSPEPTGPTAHISFVFLHLSHYQG